MPKIDYANIPADYLKETTTKDDIRTDIYQITALHKEFAQPLNVVIIVKTNLKTGAWAHVILFSSDLDLAWEKVIDYYRLRFQTCTERSRSRDLRHEDSNVNVLDLKALYLGHKYVVETIKLLPEKPDPILLSTIFQRISGLGRIHNPHTSLNSP